MDMHLAIAERNAWFRAWKADGVRIEAAWREVHGGGVCLFGKCLSCFQTFASTVITSPWPIRPTWPETLAAEEQNVLKGHKIPLYEGGWQPCPAFARILAAPSPEVLAIVELELLTNG